ncbi:hypothetical protein JW859_07150 [bacterium]|nr:hypothetical protein [bacterium]
MGNVLTTMTRAGSLAALLVAGVNWLSSCGGAALKGAALDTTTDAAQTAPAAQDFASLPTPREAAALTAELPESSRSYWTESNSFYASNAGPGVTQELPEFYIHFTPTAEGLNYAVLDIPRMKVEGSVLAQVYLDIDWQDYLPDRADYEGFYVGYPDYEQDLWQWRGPLVSTADFADFAGERLASHPDEDQDFDSLMLVNFSQSKAVVEMINFTALYPDDVFEVMWFDPTPPAYPDN